MLHTEKTDQHFMEMAFDQALEAYEKEEVPVGCVVVFDNKVIGQAHNRVEQLHDATAHAEMLAITQASEFQQSWRLEGVSLYTTLEPCMMCFGAIHLSRIDKVVFACKDPKMGIGHDVYDCLKETEMFRKVNIISGLMAQESSELLKSFFQKLRKNKTD